MNSQTATLPNRFERPGIFPLLGTIAVVWFLVRAFEGAEIAPEKIIEGIPFMREMISEMFPPDVSRLTPILKALLITFQMAFIGTVLGVLLSLPAAILASRNLSPSPTVYRITRIIISFIRSIPDLVWGLFFVVSVGLGPFAGTLALMVDTIGFCGRFFAESIEEIDSGPREALGAIGAGRISQFFCAVLPAALPSFLNTGLYALEKATRGSVVLGLVGAGGIGIELKVAMDTFQFNQASTVILSIFLLVVIVEQISSTLRQRVMNADQEKISDITEEVPATL